MTGTSLGKEIEKHFVNHPRVKVIRTNVNKRSKYIKGLPDGFSDFLILIKPGKALFLETKSKNEPQRPAQKEFQAMVNGLGFPYVEARTMQDVEAAIICN